MYFQYLNPDPPIQPFIGEPEISGSLVVAEGSVLAALLQVIEVSVESIISQGIPSTVTSLFSFKLEKPVPVTVI